MAWSPFTSAVDVANRHYPYLPVNWLMRHRFENLAKIARVKTPTVIAHGRLDGMIPFEMSDRLAAAAGGPVTRVTIDDANHNDLLAIGNQELLEATSELMARLSGLK